MATIQKMVRLANGKRTPIKLDPATWAAIERLAGLGGHSWQEWCSQALSSVPEGANATAALREAAVEGLLGESVLQQRADEFQATGMRLAGVCSDEQFFADLSEGHVESVHEFGGFKLRSGIDASGRVCYWVENGLRDGVHLVLRTPFGADKWQKALEDCDEG